MKQILFLFLFCVTFSSYSQTLRRKSVILYNYNVILPEEHWHQFLKLNNEFIYANSLNKKSSKFNELLTYTYHKKLIKAIKNETRANILQIYLYKDKIQKDICGFPADNLDTVIQKFKTAYFLNLEVDITSSFSDTLLKIEKKIEVLKIKLEKSFTSENDNYDTITENLIFKYKNISNTDEAILNIQIKADFYDRKKRLVKSFISKTSSQETIRIDKSIFYGLLNTYDMKDIKAPKKEKQFIILMNNSILDFIKVMKKKTFQKF